MRGFSKVLPRFSNKTGTAAWILSGEASLWALVPLLGLQNVIASFEAQRESFVGTGVCSEMRTAKATRPFCPRRSTPLKRRPILILCGFLLAQMTVLDPFFSAGAIEIPVGHDAGRIELLS